MNLKYIYHSSFLLEMEESVFIFDYFKGEIPEFDRSKRLYVFSTHAHGDHFSKKIFEKFGSHKKVKFILSDDIEYENNNGYDITYVSPNKQYSIDNLLIETLKSTDEGIAIIINSEGKTVYHSGDLNWWTWVGFESEEEYNAMTKAFKEEIEKIKGRHFHLAMMVLDYRQKERYDWGLKYLLENTKIDYVAPMHCWDKFEVIENFKKDNKDVIGETVIIYTDKIGEQGYNL